MKKQLLIILLSAVSSVSYAQGSRNPVSIGQERGHSISKAQLANDPVLRLPQEHKDFHITSFQVSYVPKEKGRELQGPFTIKGDDMRNGKAAEILNKLQPGDRIFFEEIVAVNKEGKQLSKLSAAIKIE